MTLCPRRTISPTESGPFGSSLSSASTTRTSMPHSRLPIDITRRSSALRLNVAIAHVSDRP